MLEQETGSRTAAAETNDRALMEEALSLAGRGTGLVSPNPVVGALVVRDGLVVGRGWHERYGSRHAEVAALEEAGDLARGATVYVTLEPCCVWGNTPPCTDALIRAGVREVVVAMEDPNPAVSGRGLEALRAAGILVRSGVLADEAARANAGYVRFRETGLPSVLLKLALSLDGRVAAPEGGPRWTSSMDSREVVHEMRSEADCVMVGVGTVLADDPLLTDRREGAGPRQPARLVLDTHLRTPPESAIVASADVYETIVACGRHADPGRRRALEERGVAVWEFDTGDDSRVDAGAALGRLASSGKLNILAEGGPIVAATLLNEGLADRVVFFMSPVLYGSAGVSGLREVDPVFWKRGWFARAMWASVGDDMVFRADVVPRRDRTSAEDGR